MTNSKKLYIMGNSKTLQVSYFFVIAILGLLAVLIGFSKTFIIPLSKGSFSAPAIVYVHGAFAFTWILLFIVQTSLIHFKKYKTHIFIGTFGLLIAIGTSITMFPVGIYAANKELSNGLGETAISGFLGVVTSACMYLALVIFAVIYREKPAVHKRLILLSILVVLWPAWFRFRHYFPSVPRPDIWFAVVLADSLIVVSCIWDKVVNGKIHNVFKYVGIGIIAEHLVEIFTFDNETWRIIAKSFYNLLA